MQDGFSVRRVTEMKELGGGVNPLLSGPYSPQSSNSTSMDRNSVTIEPLRRTCRQAGSNPTMHHQAAETTDQDRCLQAGPRLLASTPAHAPARLQAPACRRRGRRAPPTPRPACPCCRGARPAELQAVCGVAASTSSATPPPGTLRIESLPQLVGRHLRAPHSTSTHYRCHPAAAASSRRAQLPLSPRAGPGAAPAQQPA